MSQRTMYCTPVGSVYVVPFAAEHCGPYREGLGDAEEDMVDDCIDIVALVPPEEPGEEVPDDVATGDEAAIDELEVVDCADTKMPAT